ncbi:MAG: hypothetical protein KJO91_09645, partial [Gammaproteobacteria bacterium]|nr:hypothetical protein [Gammaproteobacteria bacterium]
MSDAQADVSITGVDDQLRDNILAYLRLDDESCDAAKWRIRRQFAAANTEIREALEVVGFYRVEISKRLERGDSCWQATFDITLGKPVLLRTVSIEIDTGDVPDSELLKVVSECALNPGDVLQHARYDACRRRIARVAENRGYFDAEFLQRRVDVFPDEYAADITLQFTSGPRFVFGDTTFDQEVLDPDLVQRFARLTPGEYYDAEQVRRVQRDFVSTSYFDQVVFTPTPRGEP